MSVGESWGWDCSECGAHQCGYQNAHEALVAEIAHLEQKCQPGMGGPRPEVVAEKKARLLLKEQGFTDYATLPLSAREITAYMPESSRG